MLYDQWKNPGDITNVPKQSINNSSYQSTRYLEDASYLRLNALTIGYTIPKAITKKFAVQNLRVYATGGNLFCLTGYSGLDPEVNTKYSSNDYPKIGVDRGAYPRARTFTFGINVEF